MRNILTNSRSILLAATLALAGCTMPAGQSPQETADVALNLRYFKDRHGLCYATVSSVSYGFHRVASITTVPCDKVGL